ncbi:MAG: hypothetical protein ACOYL6_16855 [Bacteriovoracaceae bacterium]
MKKILIVIGLLNSVVTFAYCPLDLRNDLGNLGGGKARINRMVLSKNYHVVASMWNQLHVEKVNEYVARQYVDIFGNIRHTKEKLSCNYKAYYSKLNEKVVKDDDGNTKLEEWNTIVPLVTVPCEAGLGEFIAEFKEKLPDCN